MTAVPETTTFRPHITSALARFVRFAVFSLRPWACALILVLFLTLLLLRFYDFPLEALQWVFFAPILFALHFLARKVENRLPSLLLSSAIALFVLSAADVVGVLRGRIAPASLYLSQLSNDPIGGHSRELLRRFGAQGVSISMASRRFGSYRDAERWISMRPEVLGVLEGDRRWTRLFLRPLDRATVFDHSPAWIRDAEELQIDTRLDGQTLPHRFGDDALFIVSRVEAITLPIDSPELSGEYLAFLLDGLRLLHLNQPQYEAATSLFRLAASVQGGWKSSTPMAFAEFLAAGAILAEAVDPGEFRCAIGLLRHAQTIIQRRSNVELATAIHLNRVVAQLSIESHPRRIRGLVRTLRALSRVKLKGGERPVGSRVAELNLRVLERNGF